MTQEILVASSATRSQTRSWRVRGRVVWLAVHRWVGLVLGAIFVVIGLTGAVLAFRQPLDEAINSSAVRVEPPKDGASRASLDEIFRAAKAKMPRDAVATFLSMPRHPGAAVAISYRTFDDEGAATSRKIYVDPYRAVVTGDELIKVGDDEIRQAPTNSLLSLHRSLWLGSNYSYLVGTAAILLLLSMIFGVVLWWPRPGQWSLAFKIKPGASAERRIFDLHRVFGAAFVGILCMSLFTGAYMTFRSTVRDAVRLFSPVREAPHLVSTPIIGKEPIGLDDAARIAGAVFPNGKLISISLPTGDRGVYVAGERTDDEPSRTFSRNRVTIDRYSGETLYVEDRATYSAGERFLEWLRPLHTGEAFGNVGRTIILATGLMTAFLYVTGVVRGRQRRRNLAAPSRRQA